MDKIFNQDVLDSFSVEAFQKRWPFPWIDFEKFLTPQAFKQLHDDFPPLELFEYHENRYRLGQRPHDRYYLAYGKSFYGDKEGPGNIQKEDLSLSWQQFIEELETGPIYRNFINKALDNTNYTMRLCWHAGKTSNEVSPHIDNYPVKVGTHIFYFNTSEDWDPTWGGQLLIFGDKLVPGITPNFSDFVSVIPVKILDNHSFLFKNTPNAWHGVKPLKCPEGKYRKLFNVIFEVQP